MHAGGRDAMPLSPLPPSAPVPVPASSPWAASPPHPTPARTQAHAQSGWGLEHHPSQPASSAFSSATSTDDLLPHLQLPHPHPPAVTAAAAVTANATTLHPSAAEFVPEHPAAVCGSVGAAAAAGAHAWPHPTVASGPVPVGGGGAGAGGRIKLGFVDLGGASWGVDHSSVTPKRDASSLQTGGVAGFAGSGVGLGAAGQGGWLGDWEVASSAVSSYGHTGDVGSSLQAQLRGGGADTPQTSAQLWAGLSAQQQLLPGQLLGGVGMSPSLQAGLGLSLMDVGGNHTQSPYHSPFNAFYLPTGGLPHLPHLGDGWGSQGAVAAAAAAAVSVNDGGGLLRSLGAASATNSTNNSPQRLLRYQQHQQQHSPITGRLRCSGGSDGAPESTPTAPRPALAGAGSGASVGGVSGVGGFAFGAPGMEAFRVGSEAMSLPLILGMRQASAASAAGCSRTSELVSAGVGVAAEEAVGGFVLPDSLGIE